MKRFGLSLCSLVALFLLCSCATAPPAPKERYFWPRLPERPRIEWLNAYSSEIDLKGENRLLSLIAGGEGEISLFRPLDVHAIGNRLYVLDPGLHNVVCFDFDKKEVSYLVPPGDKKISFGSPVSLAADKSGNLYVSDFQKKQVMVFDKSHALVRTITLQPHLAAAGGIQVDDLRSRLIITDPRDHKLCFFGLDGTFDRCIGKRGDADGEFNFPGAVRMNAKREIIVADVMNARIQIFDENGTFLRKFGTRGDNPGEFQVIKGLGLDSDGHVYVTDGKAHSFSIFTDTGEYLLTVGGRFSVAQSQKLAPGGFLVPQGIFFLPDDRFFVADQLNSRIQEFRYLSDAYVAANPIPGYTPGEKGKSAPPR